jgi:hypothetical protein
LLIYKGRLFGFFNGGYQLIDGWLGGQGGGYGTVKGPPFCRVLDLLDVPQGLVYLPGRRVRVVQNSVGGGELAFLVFRIAVLVSQLFSPVRC